MAIISRGNKTNKLNYNTFCIYIIPIQLEPNREQKIDTDKVKLFLTPLMRRTTFGHRWFFGNVTFIARNWKRTKKLKRE